MGKFTNPLQGESRRLSEISYDSSDFDSIDPKLEEASKEITAILEKHKIAGCIQMSSSTHHRFHMYIPEWSAVWFESVKDKDGSEYIGVRLKSSSERDGPDHLSSSVGMLLGMRDMCMEHAHFLMTMGDGVEETLKKNDVDIEHTPLREVIPGGATPDSLKDQDNEN